MWIRACHCRRASLTRRKEWGRNASRKLQQQCHFIWSLLYPPRVTISHLKLSGCFAHADRNNLISIDEQNARFLSPLVCLTELNKGHADIKSTLNGRASNEQWIGACRNSELGSVEGCSTRANRTESPFSCSPRRLHVFYPTGILEVLSRNSNGEALDYSARTL